VIWSSPISIGPSQEATLSIMAPSVDVFSSVIERRRFSLLIAMLGIGLGVALAGLLANRVSRPIRLLTGEAYRLRQFEFGNMPQVRSKTLEVHQLAQAVETLQRSLKDFACYVPSQIVRRLLAGEMTSEIGGDRCQVTLMFSDIEGFTTMSEQMTPMELLRDTSEYFTAVTEVIRAGGGTIDRFIGDAVMAMWNAPARQMDHVTLACGSVLGAAEVVNEFNERRVAQGKLPFKTRFSVHVGDAVVGNVGSNESMTYTAIGATVNLASRLEGLNKVFGTQILVSEQVHEEIAGRFNTRPLDVVRPAGATRPLVIYELFEDLEIDGEPVDVNAFLESWNGCRALYVERRWADAAEAFTAHLAAYPGDHAAEALRERARVYLAEPPPDDWDGVFVAEFK
jgi:adenylate cyclase